MPGPGLDLVGEEELARVAGVIDPDLAPFGPGMRDIADTARRRAERSIEAHRGVVA